MPRNMIKRFTLLPILAISIAHGQTQQLVDSAPAKMPKVLRNSIYDISIGSDGTIVAVGGNGLVYSETEYGSTEIALGSGRDLRAVWAMDRESVFVVSSSGAVHYYNGDSWRKVTEGTPQLDAIWGTTNTNVIAVGLNGTALHYDGQAWEAIDTGTTEHLLAIHGSSPENVVAVGTNGTVLRFDGKEWQPISKRNTISINAVWAYSQDDIVVAGSGGFLERYRNGEWTSYSSEATYNFRDIEGTSPDQLFLVAKSNLLFSLDGDNLIVSERFDDRFSLSSLALGKDDELVVAGSLFSRETVAHSDARVVVSDGGVIAHSSPESSR